MNEIKHVLALTDLSSELTAAVRAGALTAEKFGAKLTVLHVVEDNEANYDFISADVQAKLKAEAAAGLDAAVKDLGHDSVQMTTMVREGSPFDQISEVVRDEKVDLIVCGVGHGDDQTEGMGIVSKRLAHKIPVDLLFVRAGHETQAAKVLVATDFSDCSADAMKRAIAYAKASGLDEIRMVTAYEMPSHSHLTGHSQDEVQAKMAEHAQRHSDEFLAKIDTQGIKVHIVCSLGKPAEVICNEAKAYGANRIFVGSHGRTASSAVLLGNVAERVVRSAPCSVWAERTDGQAHGFAAAIARLMGIE